MSAEVGYYTYLYAKVNKNYYQRVSGYTKFSTLIGRFSGSVLGQVLVSYQLVDLRELNYLTLAAQGISLIIAIFIPSVGISLYFYAENTDQDSSKAKPKFSPKRAVTLLWQHFLDAYSNLQVIQWSVW